ncbi:MAG TPA: tRNA pseudouridine(38-40) synthase TruA [Fimbriimonadaceae bacterium]|nr:tRNA pseudouridine(38-40) synthase TruA [Fimbriimonadaceae bacterium]HRJ96367.1 tRNA pseudouridine(38-40) synthase TruA [Fimbriimonadaceae bacterium]
MSTRRIRLVVAYDGTDFCGWAAQHGQRTVQSTLTETIGQISGEPVWVQGASRTDSGAHARGQVCHFDSESGIPPDKWAVILGKRLPRDVCVRRSDQVPANFESRFWAVDRTYRYRILTGWRDPQRARYAHHYGRRLDATLMDLSARNLVGEHDFRSFGEELERTTNTVRTLFEAGVREVRDEIWIDVVGTAFVRGMMRRIAGALLEIGRGARPASDIVPLLARNPDIQLPEVLPARGLTLMRVRYGRHPSDHRRETVSK